MLIREVIERIQSQYSKGVASDDSRLSNRLIYNKMLTVRGKLLVQRSNKGQKINQWNYQGLPCVQMESVPVYDCPCIPVKGMHILRTKFRIPKLISGISTHLFQSITSVDGYTKYDETEWENKKYSAANKYTSKKLDFFLRDGYLYITSVKNPEVITITALFQDPIEAYLYPSCCGDVADTCISHLDREFPLDADIVDTLVDMASIELIDKFTRRGVDKTNNSQDDRQQTTGDEE